MTFNEQRMEVFSRICPPLYLDTDVSRLPVPAADVLALPYPEDGQGVLLAGPSRTGKTRTAWMLAQKWFCKRDWTMKGYNGGEFGRAVADNYGDGTAEEWHEMLRDLPILLLDDIFKHRMTDAVQDALFSVVEDRMAYKRPTIITINNGFAGVQSAISPDMAEPFICRISESCAMYPFITKPIEQKMDS